MGTKHFLAACAGFLLSGVASTAGATPLTINPKDFPLGTDLSTMFEGVTLSRLDGSNSDVLDATFHSPTSFLEIKSFFFSDGPSVLEYGLGGNRITFALGEYVATNTPLDTKTASTIVMRRGQSDISKIVFGDVGGNSTPVESTYNVPEPSTAGLLLLGLVGATVFRRRPR